MLLIYINILNFINESSIKKMFMSMGHYQKNETKFHNHQRRKHQTPKSTNYIMLKPWRKLISQLHSNVYFNCISIHFNHFAVHC